MNEVLSLDCTLRDGGYCNQWYFKQENIKKIISALLSANADIIECGFLTNTIEFNSDYTKYDCTRRLNQFVPRHKSNTKFVLMLNYGEYDVEKLPYKEETKVDGIRIAFHKKDRFKIAPICRKIAEKGYDVFIQPMVTLLYSEEEFEEIIRISNEINPYAFYIVDSFGVMQKWDLMRYFEIADANLKKSIKLGFHSHNNLQSAFSNAQSLLEKDTQRGVIIDSSIYGMGRGAGNLNTELFFNELNSRSYSKYKIRPLLHVMDEVINRFYEEKAWGYTLPNYLSAIRMIHPNYASYLSEKKTLTIEDIDEIFAMMDSDRAVEYDEEYIRSLYIEYMSRGAIENEHLDEIKKKVQGKKILLIAPGKSAIDEQNKIKQFIDCYEPIIISINHVYPIAEPNFIFVSNIRRFAQIDEAMYYKTISTSNIKNRATYMSTDYFELLNTVDDVRDNAGLMAIKFVKEKLEKEEVYIAGLDGYSYNVYDNFETKEMALLVSAEFMDRINEGMKEVIRGWDERIKIRFITSSIIGEYEK